MKRSYSFLTFFFLIAVLVFAITCKKEFSYEGGVYPEYNFVGSPQACTNAFAKGNYTAGIPTVDSLNTVLLYLNITAPGLIDITTDSVNGIFFTTGKLNFTDTVSNTGIVLFCHGTPDSAGTFTFHIPGNTGCSFTVTINAIQNAQYILSGSPGDCSNPIHQGFFTQGVALASSNFITINIDVIEKGPYSITTDMVNGFSFSSSGTFPSTGTQQVILRATGTPNASELSRFTLTAGASQCSFYVAVANADPLATYVLQSGIENGTLTCAPGSVQGMYIANTTLTQSNTLTVNAYVTMPGNFTISTTEVNGMKFSSTGTFTTMGAQDVILKSSGKPGVSGTFTFVPQIVGTAPLGGSSCGLDVTVQ
ncbi:MAG: hypothetical protein M3R72_05375 [Bacteroidota bacterium]|nr:hypothetical protein [Bacteroidota bacterium]